MTMNTKSKDCVVSQDTKIIFKVSRNEKDLLNIAFYDTDELPLRSQKDIEVKDIDSVVAKFMPEAEKIQILAYPNEQWFEDGCPETKFARKINVV